MENNKTKLCIIIPSLKCGGSERFVSILCNYINTNIFFVDLYILDGSDPFYQITNANISVHFLNIKNVRKSLFKILNIIKTTKPDIVFSVSNHLNTFLAIFKFLLPKKILLVARETSIVSINNKKTKYGKFYDLLVKRFYKNIDHIICQSVYMQSDLIKNYNIPIYKTVVIYNPVEEITINTSLHPHKKPNSFKFYTVARLSSEKGIDRLLTALSHLDINFTFHIIGEGTERKILEKLTHYLKLCDKVFFHGQKNDPHKNMGDADLFLIGSYYEGSPNVLLEAGMLGIPFVGYKAPGGINEIIHEELNGFLAEDDNTGINFSKAILKAIRHNFKQQSIIDLTKNSFSVNTIIKQIEDYFIHINNPR